MYTVVLVVAIMIGNVVVSVVVPVVPVMSISIAGSVKIVENEVSGEPDAGGPEWVRDP